MIRKVYVGLSGGVDSAVSAALLKRDGYDVVGVFIKIWQPEFIECTWEKDRIDAMRVAVALDIPFREIDLSDEYKHDVVERMIESYRMGETPNPDVTCNERIKFGSFYDWARADGADMVATGHYARIQKAESGSYALYRGVDAEKDQSYFLHRVSSEHLPYIRFPVGDLLKSDVRALARRMSLPVAQKHDSQGLCFVGDVSMRDFLRRYIDVAEGDVLSASGEVIGTHDGAALYTVGQRHGFRIAVPEPAKPHYVVRIDAQSNTITVSDRREDTEVLHARLVDTHWLQELHIPLTAEAQSRYREQVCNVTIRENSDGSYAAVFDAAHTVSKGQSLVIYRGDACLGGGRIA